MLLCTAPPRWKKSVRHRLAAPSLSTGLVGRSEGGSPPQVWLLESLLTPLWLPGMLRLASPPSGLGN